MSAVALTASATRICSPARSTPLGAAPHDSHGCGVGNAIRHATSRPPACSIATVTSMACRRRVLRTSTNNSRASAATRREGSERHRCRM